MRALFLSEIEEERRFSLSDDMLSALALDHDDLDSDQTNAIDVGCVSSRGLGCARRLGCSLGFRNV